MNGKHALRNERQSFISQKHLPFYKNMNEKVFINEILLHLPIVLRTNRLHLES